MDGRFDSTLHDEFRRRLLAARESLLRTVAASDEEVSALEAPGPGDSLDNASSRSMTTSPNAGSPTPHSTLGCPSLDGNCA